MKELDPLRQQLAGEYKNAGLTEAAIRFFRELIMGHYERRGRTLPWRETYDPYCILVSEIMLQQTQVTRVLPKYAEFTAGFPSFAALAGASVREVLEVWRGLGYNRRALALLDTARLVHSAYGGLLPSSPEALKTFPGIGSYTAAAIAVFAFDQPVVLIETNIRAVFLHQFFHEEEVVPDRWILPLIEKTLDPARPREWYYALMDYGADLKKIADPGRRSAVWRRQSPFAGSNRQLRSMILSLLMENPPLTEAGIAARLKIEPATVARNLVQLEKEGFISKDGRMYMMATIRSTP